MQWLLACILLCLFAGMPVQAADEVPLACEMVPDLTAASAPLTAVATALATKGAVDILALGSGSTVGEGGGASGPAFVISTPGASFPYRMVDALKLMRPGARFRLTVGGGRNMTAEAMLPILRRELATYHYDLVIWQTGTVEAVRGLRPDTLHGVLEDGVAAAAEAHADVVLVDPQFSRFLRANVDLGPYQAVLRQIAGSPGVTLFHRFELTQGWVDSGQADLERAEHDARDKTVAILNTCLGHALARYVLTGASEH